MLNKLDRFLADNENEKIFESGSWFFIWGQISIYRYDRHTEWSTPIWQVEKLDRVSKVTLSSNSCSACLFCCACREKQAYIIYIDDEWKQHAGHMPIYILLTGSSIYYQINSIYISSHSHQITYILATLYVYIYILYIPWKFFSISIMTNPSTISQLYIYQRKAFHFLW